MTTYNIRYINRYLDTNPWGRKHSLGLVIALLSVLFGLGSSSAAQAQGACPPGVVHYFGLDETEAGSYRDYASNTLATCTGCPVPAGSRFAGGQRFNGSNTGLLITDIANFEWNQNSNFTMEVWVQVAGSSANNRVIVGRASKNTDMSWWLGIDAQGYAVFDMRDNTGKSHVINDYQKIVNLNDGKWHHIAIVRDGIEERTKLYVDGFRVDDLRIDLKKYEGSFESSSPVTIGYLDLGNMYRFNGVIDEFRVYNRDLNEPEMRSRYNNGAGNYCGPRQFAPEIVSTPITFATVGQQYRYEVYATGNPDPSYRLLNSPPGMAVNFRLGVINWVPTTVGSFTVEVMASNSAGDSAPQKFQVNVRPATEEPIGILHHWPLNESGGNTFADVYTPIDAIPEVKKRPAAVKGAVGMGQRFNGRDTGLDVIGSPNFDWKSNESFTIELWLRTETRNGGSEADNQVLVGRHAKDSPSQWWLGLDKDRKAAFYLPDIRFEGNFVGSAGPKLNDGAWHQLVAVRDGGSGATRLYVDGVQVAAANFVYNNEFTSRSPVTIGYFNASLANSYQYEGDMDEVKLFGRALTPEEIKNRFTEVYYGLTEILSFEGRYADGESFNQKVVVLDWRTLNELDTDFFEIERSEDGENFTAIGQVKASGTTTAAIDYTYTDTAPFKERGYYRLRLVRLDGAFIYSNIILVQDRSPIASSFKVYPNPAARGDEVIIEIANLKEEEEVTFMVTDLSGRQVMRQQVRTDAAGELYLTLPVDATLTPGIYNLTVAGSNKTLNRKLVVGR
jgi:hypothetical protein